MPELPEVEIIKNFIAKTILFQQISEVFVLNHRLRYAVPENLDLIQDFQIIRLERRAKFIQIFLSNNQVIIIHLGMSGSLLLFSADYEPKKHDHVIFILSQNIALVYNDPRRFGFIDCILADDISQYKFFQKLGIEPLSEKLTFATLRSMLGSVRLGMKNFLMDSKFIVGIGNIYANEILFASTIHPLTTTNDLDEIKTHILLASIKQILQQAINLGGSSIENFVTPDGQKGHFSNHFKVYGKHNSACTICGNIIEKIIIQQRSTFFCPFCQR